MFFLRKLVATNTFMVLISFWVIYSMKKYILLSFLPALILWVVVANVGRIRPVVARILVVPIALVVAAILGYYSILKVGEDDPRYRVSKLAETAKVTAYDIRYGWGARTGEGSGYTLGTLDGSWASLVRLAPSAINVSLFRPYLWEIRNPLMLLSGLESLLFLVVTIWVMVKARKNLFYCLKKPEVIFCLTFAIIFAFAVGVSTFNFGTLSRYKIPMEPFYLLGIGLVYFHSKRDRKLEALDKTE